MAREVRYCFSTEVYDIQAALVKKYNLFYFLNDNTIEIFDVKLKKNFLKRCEYPAVTLKEIIIGSTVTIYSRQYKIVDYADEFTRNNLGNIQERISVIVKPSAYLQMGKVLSTLIENDFVISRLKMIRLSGSQADLYGPDLSKELRNQPCLLVECVGKSAQERLSKIVSLADSLIFNKFAETVNFSLSTTAKVSNCTLCIVKPSAVKSTGAILQRLLDEGFDVSAMDMYSVNNLEASEFYEVYKGVLIEYSSMVSELASGPLVCIEIIGSVNDLRQLCGPSDPEIAKVIRPNTLRALYGTDKIKNAVHCTDLEEDGVLEVEYFFSVLAGSKA